MRINKNKNIKYLRIELKLRKLRELKENCNKKKDGSIYRYEKKAKGATVVGVGFSLRGEEKEGCDFRKENAYWVVSSGEKKGVG